MSIFRVYFYTKDGTEMSDHPLNGKYWLASSGWISVNGEFKRGYREQITVADFASMRKIAGEKRVTIDAFPGHDRVGVKVWHGPGNSDKFWLVRADHFSNRA